METAAQTTLRCRHRAGDEDLEIEPTAVSFYENWSALVQPTPAPWSALADPAKEHWLAAAKQSRVHEGEPWLSWFNAMHEALLEVMPAADVAAVCARANAIRGAS